MRARLIIRFGSAPDEPVQWVRLNAEGRPQGGVATGSLEEAAKASDGKPVVALLPGFDVLLLSAHMPTQSRQKLMRAIPFALEDQLADDIEELHFVPGQRDEQGRLAVAVVSNTVLAEWLAACNEAGLDVEQAHSEILALPQREDAWTVFVDGPVFLVRTGTNSGFAGDTFNALPLLEAALEEAGERAPTKLIVYGSGELDGFNELGLTVDRQPLEQPLLSMAANFSPKHSINLRVGTFAHKRGMSGQWLRWQTAAVLLLAWIVVDVSAAYLQQWQYSRELAVLNTQIEQTYQEGFPGAGRLVNPRQQVETRLQALRGGGGDSEGMLELLTAIAPTLKENGQIELNALNYRNGEIDLEFFADNLQDVDELKQKLDNLSGVSAEVRTARAEGERVQGRLRIGASS
ncbi:type II secretion system protein GspL [Alkalilimnicola ehrlichii]|uniref:Type II secretion system protein L n=1 Tax=Alkalilimnicola ehrlichii TaxID=351052 RepID=A0A3E0X3Q5_9GAMM|nr:type II secretion system protein GspL [Alkalilimnicola ehrlichii]RFA31423.1 type II secretion system protein GspL [Alkalilimnicola ehrlichii]RFA39305.1 type II secretion system protein GspL [Alkalilimnicola ehrlichii]